MVMTTIEEGTHLRLKTERMAVDSDILVWRDGKTYGRTYGRTASFRNAMDPSKNNVTFKCYSFCSQVMTTYVCCRKNNF